MTTQAVRAEDFANSIGINTHLDFGVTAYHDVSVVESALTYLGVKQVRDAMQFPTSPALFAQVAAATGIKYDLFLAPGAEADLPGALQDMRQLPINYIQSVEGRNEADLYGPGFQQGIADQITLFQFARQNLPGVPVIQESFAGLPDYTAAGDQSAYADFGNAHTYFGTGNNPGLGDWIGTLNGYALQATPGKPVIITEAGYFTTGSTANPHSVDVTVQAKYTLDFVLDAYQAGDVKTFLYELLDERSGDGSSEDNFGLFLSDGTPKPAATAIRNLLTLLADPGSASSFAPGLMTYSLSGLPSGGNSYLMEKSDGSYLLAVWDDTRLSGPVTPTDIVVPPVPVSVNLGFTANINVFDPLTGTSVIQTANGVTNVTISLPDHPVLVEILRVSGGATAPPVDPPPGNLVGPSFTVPGGETVTPGQTIAVMGVRFDDSAAAGAPGALSLNVSSIGGNFTMQDGAGNVLTGSGTKSIFTQGTLAQLNADLATLSYTAGTATGRDQLSITITDQTGKDFGVAVQVSILATGGGAPPPPPGPSITAPVTETVAGGPVLPVTGAAGATPPGAVPSVDTAPILAQPNSVRAHTQYIIANNNGSLYIQDLVPGRDGTRSLPANTHINFADGTGVFDPTGNAEEVGRLYQAALGRAPEVGGLDGWTAQLDHHTLGISEVALGFINSAEFSFRYGSLDQSAFVTQLYQNVLHRAPDSAGAQGWINQLNGGISRAQVLIGFSDSLENKLNTLGSIGDTHMDEAYRLYQAALNRTPDTPGLGGWTAQLDSGVSPLQVAEGFVGSDEFTRLFAGLDIQGFVDQLYHNGLHRAPDSAGEQGWIDQLNGGVSKAQVLLGFSDSLENRLNTSQATHDSWVFVRS